VSIVGGVYESRSISIGSSSDSGIIYRNGTSYTSVNGSSAATTGYPYYRDTGTVKNTLSVTSIGIFFEPEFRWTTGPADGYGFHGFISLYTEVIWQKVTNTFDYSGTGRADTMYAPNLSTLYTAPYKESSTSADFRSHYVGLGFPILVKTKIFAM